MISKSKVIVRYAETDQMGIVHHSVYAIWYELARTEYIKKLGISYSKMEQMGIMTPLYELHSKYLSPAKYEDELTICVWIKQIKPITIEFHYEIYKNQKEKPINIGSTIHAWVGTDLKPMNLKKNFPEIYQKIEAMIE